MTASRRPLRRSAGFTLIELMIVVVIIGLLAAIAVPKFAESKSRAYVSAQRSDLANLAMQQEGYFFSNRTYSNSVAAVGITPSVDISLVINEASGTGWSASTSHAATSMRCAVFYGSAAPVAPAVTAGVMNCE
ncbi:MAG: type IV pilin protein [Gemmatimonas sp.]